MGKKVESYQAEDGKLFATERLCVLHEIETDLRANQPKLLICVTDIMANIDTVYKTMQRMAVLFPENHPEALAQTIQFKPFVNRQRYEEWVKAGGKPNGAQGYLEGDRIVYPDKAEPEDLTCDCLALMHGDSNHARTCATQIDVPIMSCPYHHPEGTRCPHCANWAGYHHVNRDQMGADREKERLSLNEGRLDPVMPPGNRG